MEATSNVFHATVLAGGVVLVGGAIVAVGAAGVAGVAAIAGAAGTTGTVGAAGVAGAAVGDRLYDYLINDDWRKKKQLFDDYHPELW